MKHVVELAACLQAFGLWLQLQSARVTEDFPSQTQPVPMLCCGGRGGDKLHVRQCGRGSSPPEQKEYAEIEVHGGQERWRFVRRTEVENSVRVFSVLSGHQRHVNGKGCGMAAAKAQLFANSSFSTHTLPLTPGRRCKWATCFSTPRNTGSWEAPTLAWK